ncbi:MAG: SEC-C metal-binding domain-containing protein [Acidimicrobiales bacterium]
MAPRITFEQSGQQARELSDRVDAARNAGDSEAELDAHWALLEHPCAHHQIVEHEVLDEVHQVLRRLGRFDEAIQAKREAIDAGYRSSPDPEADIAECLVEAGRRDEADALFAELRRRDPDDVWLYNSAGWAYGRVDDREALRWLRAGIDVAIATGDVDQVIGQLLDMTRACWDRLEENHDTELVARVEAFERDWVRPPRRDRSSGTPSRLDQGRRRCGHCGFDPDRPPISARTPGGPLRPRESAKVALSLAWFPADEWESAVQRWPHLTEDFPVPHDEYSHRIEARMKWLARHEAARVLTISPLSVDELIETEGANAGTGEGRSHLAADVARTGRAIPWPPARNDLCWCGSGRKYKKCCGPVAPAEED